MAYPTLLIEKKAQAVIITINRPNVLNALNRQVLEDLDHAIRSFHEDANQRLAIITGSGDRAFAAGADIAEIRNVEDEKSALELSRFGQEVFNRIEGGIKPVIAAVNGFALGGGCELALACHMRIASENARFGQPEVKLGIIAGYGGTQRLTRLIGRGKASEMLLTGEMMTAEEALQCGLINYIVPQPDLLEKALDIAGKIAGISPSAAGLTLLAIHHGSNHPESGFEAEQALFSKAALSSDGREGTRAFLEKRKAQFPGDFSFADLQLPDFSGKELGPPPIEKQPENQPAVQVNPPIQKAEIVEQIQPEIQEKETPANDPEEVIPQAETESIEVQPTEFVTIQEDIEEKYPLSEKGENTTTLPEEEKFALVEESAEETITVSEPEMETLQEVSVAELPAPLEKEETSSGEILNEAESLSASSEIPVTESEILSLEIQEDEEEDQPSDDALEEEEGETEKPGFILPQDWVMKEPKKKDKKKKDKKKKKKKD